MSTHDGGLSAREHAELRDLVLAGTQAIRPAGGHRAQFVAVGVTVAVVAAVTAGILTASFRTDDTLAPVVPPRPTPVAAPDGSVAFSSPSFLGDIFSVQAGSAPRRVIGAGDDGIDQVCPAFSPDGDRLASGQAAGDLETGWRDTALVITDLTPGGEAAGTRSFPLDGLVRPPCPIWSPDGRRVAFGAETRNPSRAMDVGEVWVVDTETGEIDRLTGLRAGDLEWAPDGSQLYVADETGVRISSVDGERSRLLADTERATTLTASPDGRALAVERRRVNALERYDLWLMNADGSDQRILVEDYARMHGIGPVWSPDGNRIVFQRSCRTYTGTTGDERICREQHEVVVVAMGDDDPIGPRGTQRVLPTTHTAEGDRPRLWFPYHVTWSPDSGTLLYLAWEEIDTVEDGRGSGAGLLTVPVDGAAPTILWETPEGIGSLAFPKNDFQSWSTR